MHRIALIAILLLLSACSSTMKAVKPDATGAFPTKDQLKPAEVIVNERFDLSPYRRLVYVQVGEKSEVYETFIVDSIRNMDYFEKVLTKTGFEQELISSGKSDNVSNISDLIGLRGASKAYGPFLVPRQAQGIQLGRPGQAAVLSVVQRFPGLGQRQQDRRRRRADALTRRPGRDTTWPNSDFPPIRGSAAASTSRRPPAPGACAASRSTVGTRTMRRIRAPIPTRWTWTTAARWSWTR
jgi:hypothetical protein